MGATGNPTRLYVKGVVQAFKGSKVNQYSHTNIVRLQGVNDSAASKFYLGKRIVYIYKSRKTGEYRTIWGRITRGHGTTGAVRAKFNRNLPPQALGCTVRVMLYPSSI